MRTSTTWVKRLIKAAAPAVFWLGLWQLAALIVAKELFIPAPLSVLSELRALAVEADFWLFTLMTLLRISLGAIGGVAAGVILGCLTFVSPAANAIFAPAVRVVRAAPVASFIILILLWVKTDFVPAVISGLMVAPIMWEGVMAGLGAADPQLLELARAYRMGRWRSVKFIYLPALRPHLASAVLSSLGLAWKSGVAAEVLCLPKRAVGAQLYYTKLYLDTPGLFAWTAVVITLSLIIECTARHLLKRGGDKK